LSSVDRYVKNAHAEHITQAVSTAIALGGVGAGDVTHIAVSAGPGSFTGLRIGLSFVKGFCMSVDRTVLPLSSLLVLAHAVACGGGYQRKRIFTALDARQGRIHWGGFAVGNNGDNRGDNRGDNDDNDGGSRGNIRRITEDRLSPPEDLLGELSRDDILVADTMGYQRSAVFGAFAGAAEIVDARESSLRRGLSCASIAFDAIANGGGGRGNDDFQWQPADRIAPNYLQMSAAEEKRASCN